MIRTPDQRLRVFISSTMKDLAPERAAVRDAVTRMRLIPVMFELGARPHPPRSLYRAYLDQSHIFVGIYWQSYGWVAPGMEMSGLEDEYRLAGMRPRLIYRKEPAPEREEELVRFLRSMSEAGDVSYKVFATPDDLAQLVQEDLALLLTESFEATRSSIPADSGSRRASRLPQRTTTLIGRAREVEEVASLFLREDTTLVTLTGAGGIGKTSLAIEVARSIEDRFADGARFVPLAAVQDPAAFPSELARVLDVREEEQRDVVEMLKERLASAQVLLVLDNFEQIIEAAPAVAELLSDAHGSKILVTSRAPLHLRAEREWAVAPLEVPKQDDSLDRVTQYAAVRLFIDRARLARPDFTPTDEDVTAIARICERLDGLPLAIELAAARVKILPPAALLKRLASRLTLLTGGPRDLPARQQTLRGAIDWSYGLLDEEEMTLFARLSIFSGGVSLEAVEEICGISDIDAFDQLFALADKSLLRAMQDLNGEPRFVMLQTVQEYAREQLAARGEDPAVRAAHARYFLEFAHRGERELRGSDQARWTGLLDREHENLRQALGWYAGQDAPDDFLEMFYALHKFWLVRGYFVQAGVWADRAVQRSEEGSARAAARGLFAAGGVAEAVGDGQRARAVWTRALEICRASGDVEGMATISNVFGRLAFQEGDMAEAGRLFDEGYRLFAEVDDDEGMGQCLNNLGRVAAIRGDVDEGLRLLNQCLSIFQRLQHQQWIARALLNIGTAHRAAGHAPDAIRSIRESTRLWHELGGDWDLADCFEDWAATQVIAGHPEEGARILGAAEALRERLHAPQWTFEAKLLEPYWQRLEDELGSERSEKARLEGRRFSLDEAVDRILNG